MFLPNFDINAVAFLTSDSTFDISCFAFNSFISYVSFFYLYAFCNTLKIIFLIFMYLLYLVLNIIF